MKKIIYLMFVCAVSLNAQVEKVWTVKIPGVSGGPTMYELGQNLIVSPSGTVLLWVSGISGVFIPGQNRPHLAWVSSKGELIHTYGTEDNSKPDRSAIIQFNDDHIITHSHIPTRGHIWLWSVNDGEATFKKIDTVADVWFSGNISSGASHSLNSESFFYGASNGPSQKDNFITLTKYKLSSKSPSFFIQKSEDLKQWENIMELPKSGNPKEFYRISP